VAEKRAPLFLIAGGPGSIRQKGPDPLVHAVLERTGVPHPRVAYVGAASGDNAAFRLLIGRMLEKAGAGRVTLAPLCGKRGNLKKAARVLEEADLVFISGGDVEEGMRVLHAKGAVSLLRRLWREGKHLFGVSAGSIMLARRWVRWTDSRDETSAELFPCLGFAPVLCDTHGESDGWGEMHALLSLCPVGATGYGIPSGAALVVEGDGSLSALGGEVHLFRRRKSGVAQIQSMLPRERGAGASGLPAER
jgi:cyanophycinase-like exopeptidase